jgi:hypothetical protein
MLGGRFIKLQGMGNAGDPDRLIVLPYGRVMFCELKRLGEKPSPLQYRKLQRLTDLGHTAFWVDSFNDFKITVNEYLILHIPEVPIE